MKVNQIITITEWVDGSGVICSYPCQDNIITVDNLTDEPSFDWWEKDEHDDKTDIKITITYYPEDYDPDAQPPAEPLAVWEKWESEIVA